MNADFSTLATFAAAGGVLSVVVWWPLGYVQGRHDRRADRRAEDTAVAGYGRAEVHPPLAGSGDASPPLSRDQRVADGQVAVAKQMVVDRLVALRERMAAAGADRSEGWDAPGALDELRAVTRAARHAADEVAP